MIHFNKKPEADKPKPKVVVEEKPVVENVSDPVLDLGISNTKKKKKKKSKES